VFIAVISSSIFSALPLSRRYLPFSFRLFFVRSKIFFIDEKALAVITEYFSRAFFWLIVVFKTLMFFSFSASFVLFKK
jgi:hypothetical protein